jgi:tetratricopeptide (TPR) repeat protein
VAQGVRQRVALLPQTAQELLGAAAIVGRQVPRALLVALAGQPEEVVLAGLEASCRARLLREEGEEEYAFAHDVIREVVEADAGAARRALLHRRAAQALEAAPAGAPAELLAYHYARSGAPEKAARYLELAGDHAWAQRAHGAAQSHYREVLERLEAMGRTQDAVRVREKLGEVLYRAGRYDAALQVLEPAAETLRAAGDWEGLGRVTASIGRALYPRGTPQEGIARLTALLELMERSGATPPPAALYAALGQLLFAAGQYGESLATSERAAELARAGGDDHTRLLAAVLASWNRANILLMRGRLGEALRLTEEALPLVEALGDLEGLLMAHRDLAYRHTLRGAVATGRGHIAAALTLAEQLGDPGQLALTLALCGWLALLGGDWRGARADLDQALALSRQIDRSPLSAYPLILRARLSLAAGERATATTGAREALALAERHQDLQALRWASAVVAEVDVLEGRPAAASARLAPLLDRDGLEDCDVTVLLPVLAWAHLEYGQVAQATDVVGQALRRTRPEEMRLVLVEALRVEGMIAIRQKRWAAAGHSLEEGLALARSMPYPYAEARLLHVYGCLHIQKGEPEAARERLAAARALFLRLGARTDVARAQQALSMLPGTPPGNAALQAMAALSSGHGDDAASPTGARLSRPQRQAWVLERLRANGPLSPRAYAQALAVSVDTALLDLRELVGQGLVRAEGTTRDRRYVLAGDDRP